MDKNEEAIKCLDRALEINPTFGEAWYFIKPGKI